MKIEIRSRADSSVEQRGREGGRGGGRDGGGREGECNVELWGNGKTLIESICF